MKHSVFVHMIQRFHQLVDVVLDLGLWEVVLAAFHPLVQVHVHEFEHERQAAGGFVTVWSVLQDFQHLHDVGVRGQPPQSLNFSKVVDLVEGGEVVFHAFDSDDLACLDALRLKHFTESAFSLLGYESVLCLVPTVHAEYYY